MNDSAVYINSKVLIAELYNDYNIQSSDFIQRFPIWCANALGYLKIHQAYVDNEIKGDMQTVVRSEPVSKKVSSEKKVTSEKKVVPKKPKAAVERKIVKSSASTAKATSSNLSATGKGYALQLAASSDPAALKKLAVSSGLQAKTKIYKNQSNGKYIGKYSITIPRELADYE